jgi:hypothetical protein
MITAPAPPRRADALSTLARAELVGYVVLRGRHPDGYRYWRWFRANNRPFVAVLVRGKTATVGCDMTTLGTQARIFPESMRRIDALFGWPPSDEVGPIDYVHAEGVPVGKAEGLAFRLYEIVRDCDWPPYQPPEVARDLDYPL